MIHDFGNIKLAIREDYDDMSYYSAGIIAETIKENKNAKIGFATGSTPVGTYKELVKMHKDQSLDFSGITAFNLDEYYPIDRSNDQSYYYFMQENLFKHINANAENLHIPNGEAADVSLECNEYEKKIKSAGGIDLQILGIGNNGHIGFNEPSESFSGHTHHVNLDQSTIEANARFFNSIDEVPKCAVTMGIKTIMLAKKIILLVNGEKKADILCKTLFGEVTPSIPASILQMHHDVIIVCDKPAASKLIKYIKNV